MSLPKPWTSLEEGVRALLKQGKTSASEEFQSMFRVFGEARIREMVLKIKAEEKQKGPIR